MQQNRMLEGCVGAALFLAGGILVYGLADWIDRGADMREFRAMVSIAGGPYEPAGDWTEDKEQASQDGVNESLQWGSVRTDYYVDEREVEEEGIFDE